MNSRDESCSGTRQNETGVAGKQAMEAYEAALHADLHLADCHYKLAPSCEELKKPKEAIRHTAQYRRPVGTKSQ